MAYNEGPSFPTSPVSVTNGGTGLTSTTVNQVLFSSASNTIAGITAGNYGVMISSSSGVPSWLANGTTGQVLTATTSGTPSWQAASGGIPTIGSSTNLGLVTWNGTTGSAVASNSSGPTVDAGGHLLCASGNAAHPGISFGADTTAGWYYNGGGIQASVGGVDSGGFTGAGALQALQGYTFQGNGSILGGITFTRTATATSYSVLSSDHYIAVTDTSSARTITLQSSGIGAGHVNVIKDESGAAGTNNITVQVNGGVKTIDGAASVAINTNYGSLRVYYNGTNWFTW